MESHPIPQQISSYQFRLVGDMTLKQFFQLGGGVLSAAILYTIGIHPFIKWPLMIFSVCLGAALAFLPIEERPLSRWFISFFSSVYSPTVFVWQSKGNYDFFTEETETQVKEDFAKKEEGVFSKLEEMENKFLNNLTSIFANTNNITTVPAIKNEGSQTRTTTLLSEKPEKKEVEIPKTSIPTIPSKQPFRPKVIVEQPINTDQTQIPSVVLQTVSPIFKEKQTNTQTAQFSPQAAPPLPPTIPNTITGQVVDDSGKIVEGAILEIRDSAGKPVRALRSNKLGHFMIVTALQNGQYDIITEKDNYEFKPVFFEAKGEIIPPILIVGKSLIKN